MSFLGKKVFDALGGDSGLEPVNNDPVQKAAEDQIKQEDAQQAQGLGEQKPVPTHNLEPSAPEVSAASNLLNQERDEQTKQVLDLIQKQDPGQKLNDVYSNLPTTKPDEAAKTLALSKKLNVDPNVVAADPSGAEAEANRPSPETLNKIATQYPVTGKAQANQAIASVSHDDTENLMKHEDMLSAMSDLWKSMQKGDEIVRLSKQQRQVGDPALNADRIAQLRDEQAQLAARAGQANAFTRHIAENIESFLRGQIIKPTQAAISEGAHEADRGPTISSPLMFALGAARGAYSYFKDQESETLYQDMVAQNPNIDKAKAEKWADIAGHASAMLNLGMMGLGSMELPASKAIGAAGESLLSRLSPTLAKTITSQPQLFEKLTLGSAVKAAAKIEASSVAATTSFGINQSLIDQFAMHKGTDNPMDWGKVVDAIPGGIEGGLMFGTVGAAAHMYNLNALARNAEASKQFLLALGENANASKFAKRAPDIHADVVGEMHRDTPLYQLYVPVTEIQKMAEKKGADPVQAMSAMGLGDKYAQALEAAKGGDKSARVAIPMDKVYENYTPEMASLAENSTFDPLGPTVAEYHKEISEQQQRIQADQERVLTESKQLTDQSPELAQAHSEIAKDFAGWQIAQKPMFMTDKEGLPVAIKDEEWAKHVDGIAKIAASYAVTEANKRGTTPHVLWQKIKDNYDRNGDLYLPTDADFKDKPNSIPNNMLHQPGDILGKNALAVTAEAIPSTKISNAINYSDLSDQERFTDKALDIVHDLDKALGFPVRIERGYGGYAGGIHPNIIAEVMPSGDPATDLSHVRTLARSLQFVFKQDAVPWFKADSTQGHNAVMFTFSDDLTLEKRNQFFGKLREALGEGAGFTQPSNREIAVIDFDGKDTPAFLKKLDDLGADHGKEFGISEVHGFGSVNEYGPEQNWAEDPSGSSVLSGAKTGSPESSNLQPWLHDRSAAFNSLLRDYETYGKAAFGDALDKELYIKRAEQPPPAELRKDNAGSPSQTFFQPGPDIKYRPMDGLDPDRQGAEARLWSKFTDPASDRWYKNHPKTHGGKVISVDIARGYSDDYVKDPLRYLLSTQNPSAAFADNMYNERLGLPVKGPVMLMAGGGGSGKSTALEAQGGNIEAFDAIMDSVMSNPVKTSAKIDKALATGRDVVYFYVHNPALDAAKLVRSRFFQERRTVPADVLTADHVRAQETLFAMHERYGHNPNVHFKIIANHIGGEMHEITLHDLEEQRYVKPGQNADEVIKNLYPQVKEVMADVQAKIDEAVGEGFKKPSLIDRVKSAVGIKEGPSGVGILFQRGTEDGPIPKLVRGTPRAYFEPTRYALRILEHGNPSSLYHELAHLILQDKFDYVKSGQATPEYLKDWRPLADMLGLGSGKITEAQHEKFATMFERYMADGEAPRPELRGVFARARNAMLRIYQNANNIGAPISDENRKVLDRLLAVESQIDDASLTLDRRPMPFVNSEAYDTAYKSSDLAAKEALHKQIAHQPSYSELRDPAIRKNIGNVVDALPVYKTISALSAKGGLKLNSDLVPEELRGHIPAEAMADNGLPPDVVASLYGYRTGNDMLTAIAGAPTRDEAIDSLIRKRVDEAHGNLANDHEAQQMAALDALHGNDSMEMLKHEYNALVDKHPTNKSVLRAVLRQRRPDEVSKLNAELAVRSRLVDDLRPLDFVRSERVARREALDAWSQGKYDDAIEAKQREMFAHELYRKTRDARDDVRATLKRMNVLTRPDKALTRGYDIDFINEARIIASQFGINFDRSADPKEHLQNLSTVSKNLDALRASSNPGDQVKLRDIEQTIAMTQGHAGDFRRKPYGEFQIMRDTLDSLIKQASEARKFTDQGKKIEHEDAVNQLVYALSRVKQRNPLGAGGTPTRQEIRALSTTSVIDHLRRAESLLKDWSFGDPEGAPTRLISWPIHDATARYKVALAKALGEYNALFEKFKKAIPMKNGETIDGPEINFVFGRNRDLPAHMELAAALMHTGNGFEPGSNGYKLLADPVRRWGDLNERGEIDTTRWYKMVRRLEQEGVITKAHYDFVQGVQDLFDKYKKQLWQVNKDTFGFYPKEVTKVGYDTPFGHYAGGYAPAFVDRILDRESKMRDLWEEQSREAHVWSVPHVSYPMTKERIAYYAHPLSLDLGSMESHIAQMMRTIHIAPVVKDVSRLISDPKVRTAIASIDPIAMEEIFIPMLDRALQQRVSSTSKYNGLDAFARRIKHDLVGNYLSWNPFAAAKVLSNIPFIAQSTGGDNLMKSAAHYFFAHNDLTKEIMSKSEFMQTRVFNQLIEEREKIRRYLNSPIKDGVEYINNNSRFMARGAAHAVDMIAWDSAYNKALHDGKSENVAVHFADETVRLSVGSHAPEDISSFEAGGEWKRLFTSTFGWRDVWLNALLTEGNLARRGDLLKKFGFVANMIVLPVLMQSAIRQAQKGFPDSNEDGQIQDDFIRSTGRTAFVDGLGFLPFGANVASGIIGLAKTGKADFNVSPSLGVFEHALQGAYPGIPNAYRAYRDHSVLAGKDIVDISSLFGALLDLPLEGPGRAIGYRHDVNTGKVQPKNKLDYLRGLATGEEHKK